MKVATFGVMLSHTERGGVLSLGKINGLQLCLLFRKLWAYLLFKSVKVAKRDFFH